MGYDAYQPPYSLHEPPRVRHSSDYGGREPPPSPLPGLCHIYTLGGSKPPPPCEGTLFMGIGEEEKAAGGRGGSSRDSDVVLGL